MGNFAQNLNLGKRVPYVERICVLGDISSNLIFFLNSSKCLVHIVKGAINLVIIIIIIIIIY